MTASFLSILPPPSPSLACSPNQDDACLVENTPGRTLVSYCPAWYTPLHGTHTSHPQPTFISQSKEESILNDTTAHFQSQQPMPTDPVLVRWSQDNQEFKVILGYITSSRITCMNLHEVFFKKFNS